jgi:hypothetical protein
MPQFIFGGIAGFLLASLLWALYIAFFRDEATALGMRFRRWVRRKLNLR